MKNWNGTFETVFDGKQITITVKDGYMSWQEENDFRVETRATPWALTSALLGYEVAPLSDEHLNQEQETALMHHANAVIAFQRYVFENYDDQ